MKKFGIWYNLSISYHSQTNRLVERFNKIISEALAKITEDEKD